MGLSLLLLLLLLLLHLVTMMGTFSLPSESAVTLTKDNHSIVFQSTDASFAPKVPSTGICGFLSVANPFNACIPLDHIGEHEKSSAVMIKAQYCMASLRFLLVSRGLCTFEMKVRHAQDAGYDAIIVADNIGRHQLLTMAGSKSGIEIPAVFVSKVAGEILAQHANGSRPDCWILPSSFENISWLVMVTSFIFLLGMIAAFAIYFLVQSRRQGHSRGSKQCRGISCQIVKALPTYAYKCEYGIQTSDACAICLEDYVDGASVRVLPCNHRFHCSCIDAWLVNWRGFCPVCKKCISNDNNATPSEHTPLLNNQVSAGELPSSEQASPMQAEALLHGVISVPDTRNYGSNGTYIGNSVYLSSNNVAPASIRRLGVSRHLSFQSLLDWNSGGSDPMNSFRASPYFTPPSFFHNSAPNVRSPPYRDQQ